MTFAKTFGCKPEIQTVANGRVNLIGEHTDYNGGFVLPTSIPQTTRVQLCRREDDMVRLATGNFEGPATEYRLGEEARNKTWTDYVQGCTWVLAREFAAKSAQFCGFDMAIESEVPMGSGLSSSAALEVAVLKAIVEAWRLREEADDMRIAQLSQKVENEFVGARVGIMDPVAAALAQEGTAIFLDTRFLKFEKIEIPINKMDLVVINSGVSHSNAHGGYNQRRSECERACEALSVPELRDVNLADLPKINDLPEPLNRRARHVVTENARVLAAVSALRSGDVTKLGELFQQSHASMRDDFQNSSPEVDTLVEIANSQPEVFGARMTGGGWGGSIVMAVEPGRAAEVASRIVRAYEEAVGRKATVLVPQAAHVPGGAMTTTLKQTFLLSPEF